jgi:hypothetical protein
MRVLRKLNRRERILVGVLVVAAAAVGGSWLLRGESATTAPPANRAAETVPPVPRIDLVRLDKPISGGEAGRRNLFAFGSMPVSDLTPAPVVLPTPASATTAQSAGGAGGTGAPGDPTAGGSAQLPPLNVKYIGSVENAAGAKVAVLVTDRQEVLTGQAGQLIANRYRVTRIGLESVDLEDVATGQSRRVALRGS